MFSIFAPAMARMSLRLCRLSLRSRRSSSISFRVKPRSCERLMKRINATSDGAAGRLLAQFDRNLMPMAFPGMLEPYGMEIAFMIPDMFELDLNPRQGEGENSLPAFLREVK